MPRPLPKGLHQKFQTPPSRRDLEEQIRDLEEQRDAAWEHYWIAMRSFSCGLPTDWELVLFRVMTCLTPAGEDAGYDAVQAALDELGTLDEDAPVRRPVKTTRHP